MSLGLRLLLLALVLGALGGGFAWIGTAPSNHAALPRFESAAQCRECHAAIWDEWQGSHHQIAYSNPEVRALAEDFRNKECQACHLPRPISETGYGQRVLPRQTQPDEGVSCLTCHLGADGSILGRNSVPNAPCRPIASPEAISVEACASCHNQHLTTDQWRASHFAQQGQTCSDCHMPHVDRPLASGSKRGRAHQFPGAHDPNMLQRAGRMEVRVQANDVVLSLTNVGAGHNFPTEERHRAVDLSLRFQLADQSFSEWQRVFRFRQPYRDEPGEDTQLPAGQTKALTVPIPAGAKLAQARLWYRLTPFVSDEDAKSTLLDEQQVTLR